MCIKLALYYPFYNINNLIIDINSLIYSTFSIVYKAYINLYKNNLAYSFNTYRDILLDVKPNNLTDTSIEDKQQTIRKD